MSYTTTKTCRTCHKPSGAYWYCREHRKHRAAKARARYQSRSSRRRVNIGVSHCGPAVVMAGVSAPVASEAYYRDQADRAGGQS